MAVVNGDSVRVYRNLTKKCYSIQGKVGGDWRVVAHAYATITLSNVRFHVNQGGYRRYLHTAQRNVHAFVCGTYAGGSYTAIEDLTLAYKDVTRVQYAGGFFKDAVTNQPLEGAERVWLTRTGVYATGVRYATGG